MLQCAAVCCSTVQFVQRAGVHCKRETVSGGMNTSIPTVEQFEQMVLRLVRLPRIADPYVAVCRSVLQCVAVCCSVLQLVTMCCNVLQCVAVCCCI